MLTNYYISEHAKSQFCKRGLSLDDIKYVCQYGRRFITAGMIHVFLGKRDLPKDHYKIDRCARLIGTTVLISSDDKETVTTAYRNRNSIRKDQKKAKYNRNKQI